MFEIEPCDNVLRTSILSCGVDEVDEVGPCGILCSAVGNVVAFALFCCLLLPFRAALERITTGIITVVY